MKAPISVFRGGKKYEVLGRDGDCVLVEDLFRFAQKPYLRKLQMWWSLRDCEKINWI